MILPDVTRSACTREEIATRLREHSRARTIFILVPGVLASIAFTSLACMKIYSLEYALEKKIGCGFLALTFVISILLSRFICDDQFQVEKEEIFLSAVPKRTRRIKRASLTMSGSDSSSSEGDKSERLLTSDHMGTSDR